MTFGRKRAVVRFYAIRQVRDATFVRQKFSWVNLSSNLRNKVLNGPTKRTNSTGNVSWRTGVIPVERAWHREENQKIHSYLEVALGKSNKNHG
jgi:hypothetical protein